MVDLQDFLSAAPVSALRWLADPVGNRAESGPFIHGVAYMAVGPEGGFSSQERQAAEAAGWQTVSLGPRILRIETACAVLATLVACDVHGQ